MFVFAPLWWILFLLLILCNNLSSYILIRSYIFQTVQGTDWLFRIFILSAQNLWREVLKDNLLYLYIIKSFNFTHNNFTYILLSLAIKTKVTFPSISVWVMFDPLWSCMILLVIVFLLLDKGWNANNVLLLKWSFYDKKRTKKVPIPVLSGCVEQVVQIWLLIHSKMFLKNKLYCFESFKPLLKTFI